MQNSAQVHKDWSADTVSCFVESSVFAAVKIKRFAPASSAGAGFPVGDNKESRQADHRAKRVPRKILQIYVSSPPAGRVAFPEARSCIVPVGSYGVVRSWLHGSSVSIDTQFGKFLLPESVRLRRRKHCAGIWGRHGK